jgi:hypothetical protein
VAREIDWSQEISDEDRIWLEQRPDMPAGDGKTNAQRLAENDEQYGKAAKDNAKSREERIADLRAAIADATNEIERLEREMAEEGNPNVAVTGDPAVGLVRDNTGVDGQTPDGAPTGKETYSDEKYWTKAKLAEEIDNRNVERTEQGLEPISRSGNRAELVERLLKDDEEIESEG